MQWVNESDRFAKITECAFGRRGSYMAIWPQPGTTDQFGHAYVYLGSCRGAATSSGKTRMFNLHVLHDGERVPYAVIMQPTQLILRTVHGDMKLCFAKPELLLFEGENGLGLRFSTTGEMDVVTKPRGCNAWETVFSNIGATVIHPSNGTIQGVAPWEWDRLRCGKCTITVLPDKSGIASGSVEEFLNAGYVRDAYPSYTEGHALVEADWQTFLANIPELPQPYEKLREQCAWNLWSFLVRPLGMIRRELLYMVRFGPTSSWQEGFQAVAFANNTRAGWDQMLVPFDYQSEVGQIPDFYGDCMGMMTKVRPPLQGWALGEMRRLGYYDKLTDEQRHDFYPKLTAWTEWFLNYRADNPDRLPQYEHGDECGEEDSTAFRQSACVVTPDLSAYLVLNYDQLALMAEEQGLADEAAKWKAKADSLLERMINRLWNGERFVCHNADGTLVDRDYSILGYLPVMLGKRLPDAILRRLVNDLQREDYFLTPLGFDKEQVRAEDLCDVACNAVRGYIYHPLNLILISGLYNAGEKVFAADVAKRYCGGYLKHGLAGNLNTFTEFAPCEWMSWTAGCYLLIAGFIK